VPVLKIKSFSGNNQTKLEKQIGVWLRKQRGNTVVQQIARIRRRARRERLIVVTVWAER
jgi:hypothetical protein